MSAAGREGGAGGDGAGGPAAGAGRAEGRFQIVNERGLHARPAYMLVQAAQRYPCEVTFERGDQSANGKSVMGVMLLCSPKGAWLNVAAEGEGAAEAVEAIGAIIAGGFGEAK